MVCSNGNSSSTQTFDEIADLCRASHRLVPVGARSKTSLTCDSAIDDVTFIDMRAHAGVVTYDSSEFLISARSGTTIAQLADVLAAEGQYLPFDPILVEQGATLGGSIASGISGACRLLYGGLRDFMLEVQLCDSQGHEVRGGGKVVKNAAGFDLPKLVVGSYGRMGIITEATLKVFPKPAGNLTLSIKCPSMRSAIDRALKLLALPLPIEALEIQPNYQLMLRLAGPIDSLTGMAQRVTHALPPGTQFSRIEHGTEEADWWRAQAAFDWSAQFAALVRVAVTHHQCSELEQELKTLSDAACLVISCGASVGWIALREIDQLANLDALLGKLMLSGVAVRGPKQLTLLGDKRWVANAHRIQKSLDPAGKYLEYV